MRVLGVDPGLAITGYGVVEMTPEGELRPIACAAIRTPSGQPLARRLAQLYEALVEVIHDYHPTVMAVERLYFGRNVTTALTVGQARGVVLLCAAQHTLEVVEYTPAEVKQAVVGYGAAPKAQVQYMVQTLLHLDTVPRPDDVADALAVAICHLYLSTAMRPGQMAER